VLLTGAAAVSFIGVSLAVALHLGVLAPVKPLVLLLFIMAITGLVIVRTSTMSVLTRLMIVLYVMPFMATVGYLINEQFVWWQAPSAEELMRDDVTIRIMLTTGIVGLAGLLGGMSLAALRRRAEWLLTRRRHRSVNGFGFAAFAALALFFSWLSAPTETIFGAPYGAAAGYATSLNFNASYLLSYVLLNMLFIDAERSMIGRRWKFVIVALITVYIVVDLQILRGDRESIGLLTSLMALYITSSSGHSLARRAQRRISVEWKRVRKLAIPGVAIVVIFLFIGFVRSSGGVFDRSILAPERRVALLTANTWTSILLTNLGIAHEFRTDMEYLYGRTYLDYLLSLPPGPITKLIGVERPLEGWRGPAWWFVGLAAGGIHIVLVPFKNFGAAGAFICMGLVGFIVGQVDRMNQRGFFARLLYASFITVSFFWAWYGDMYVVRTVMAVFLAAGAYYVTIWMSHSPVRRATAHPLRLDSTAAARPGP
jgi:hypothetical protein